MKKAAAKPKAKGKSAASSNKTVKKTGTKAPNPMKASSSSAKSSSAQRQTPAQLRGVFYTLSHENTWAKWGKSGSNGVKECGKTFSTKQEAALYAPTLVDYFNWLNEDEIQIEEDNRQDPPEEGVLLQAVNDVETDTVYIHKHVVDTQTAGASSSSGAVQGGQAAASSGTAASSGAVAAEFYKLRLETHWNSWGNSGVIHDRCDKVFHTKQAAAAHAAKLIDNFGLFGDDEVPTDKRKNPPDNGILLETIDGEGERCVVYIRKYGAGEDEGSADSSEHSSDSEDVDAGFF